MNKLHKERDCFSESNGRSRLARCKSARKNSVVTNILWIQGRYIALLSQHSWRHDAPFFAWGLAHGLWPFQRDSDFDLQPKSTKTRTYCCSMDVDMEWKSIVHDRGACSEKVSSWDTGDKELFQSPIVFVLIMPCWTSYPSLQSTNRWSWCFSP